MFPEKFNWRAPRMFLGLVVVVCLIILPMVTVPLSLGFYLSLGTRVVIYATAATGLGLILGYGGMPSLGHAMFIGVGAYVVGICSFYGMDNGWIQLAITVAFTIVAGSVVGLLALRTRALGFIMITLALGQMFYFLTISMQKYGGDDGLPIHHYSDFSPLPSLDSDVTLYYIALCILLVVMYFMWRVVHSQYGYVLRGFQGNERRMSAAGYSRIRYQLAAFIVSALICALAGMLLANLTLFTAPSYLSWQASAHLMLIVIIGGMGTIMGPLIGAVVFLVGETVISNLTQYWMAVEGILILLVALYLSRGVWGSLMRSTRVTSDLKTGE